MDLLSLIGLLLFHLVFFRRFYFQNLFVYVTSEPLDTAFPSSIHLGRCLRAWDWRIDCDPYYYPSYRALPLLSSYYPPHVFQAWLGSFLPLNAAWVMYSLTSVLHFLWASLGAYVLFQPFGPLLGFFGAVTFAYMGYAIKQNACIIYTLAWIPWVFYGANIHSWWVTGLGLGMMTLAGYWPIALYVWPLCGFYWLTRSGC